MTSTYKTKDPNIEQQIKNAYIMDFNKMRSDNYHRDKSTNSSVQPFFDRLEERLVGYIEKSTYVIGCVAWLTNRNIIETLENISGAKIIVNKEEFLSQKMDTAQKFYYRCLRGRYNSIVDLFSLNCKCCSKPLVTCPKFEQISGTTITPTDDKQGAILTCGIVNNFSKMHHKFLVFFNEQLEPTGVWTGSYNLSHNSNFSLENALYITDREVILAYIKEFFAIYPFSESYNWKSGILSVGINK